MNFTVTVNGEPITVPAGTRLSDVIDIEKPCGGRGSCGKCRVLVDGREELACRYTVNADISVLVPQRGEIESKTGLSEGASPEGELCYALDIGTTTLALALVSLQEKRAVKVLTATNPQRRFGADVISRIDYCTRHSVRDLQRVLVDEINRMIASLAVRELDTVYVSGNVTMLHTLYGVDCAPLGLAPYPPAFLAKKCERAANIGLNGVKNVVSLPSVSSFVGADIVAGLLQVGEPREGKYHLLLDLGTNAEVVLYTKEGGVATAAAAGPCFEGASIRCGMSASEGAICAVELCQGRVHCRTVGDKKATGLCGTGLIDAVAVLLSQGIIDETGYMATDFPLCENVFLSCDDVRQYQLAKSAVCSAILCLMRAQGVGFDDIETLYISGGFSAKINVKHATSSGLLPKELADRAVSVQNSSLQGTVKYACEGGDVRGLCERIRYVDLSADPHFAELFVKNMLFE